MYSIGEFSRISGISVKALRLYHEKGLLLPAHVDESTGYRYYAAANLDRARVIRLLRAMEFPLDVIREILDQFQDDCDILDHLDRHKAALQQKIASYRNITTSLDRVIRQEREAQRLMATTTYEIQEKDVPAQRIAGVRMKGHYSECGKGFAKIGRSLGRYINGKPLCLYYDAEYKDGDADFEACMPVREGKEIEGISVRELPAAHCVTLIHKGPYEELGRSYEKLLAHIKNENMETQLPSREVYLKGPGMILRGNPKNYLTEIQIPVKT